MKFTSLLFYIFLAIIGFWLIGAALQIAAWVLQIGLAIGLVLVIASLISQYADSRKSRKN